MRSLYTVKLQTTSVLMNSMDSVSLRFARKWRARVQKISLWQLAPTISPSGMGDTPGERLNQSVFIE